VENLTMYKNKTHEHAQIHKTTKMIARK